MRWRQRSREPPDLVRGYGSRGYGFEIFGPNTNLNKTGYLLANNNLPDSSHGRALFHDRQLCGQ